MLPVSLQVLDAGEGGGGMSILSAFSLFDVDLTGKLAVRKYIHPLSLLCIKRYTYYKLE